MAKAKIKGLDNAVQAVIERYNESIRIAVEEAVDRAKTDVELKAYSCLIEYYNDYPDPTQYTRTYSLKDCLVPYAKVAQKKKNVWSCDIGIVYDATRLEGTYSGSQQYTPTDPTWIIDNYLAGIHPRTDGSFEVGGGDYENQRYVGNFSPSVEMQRFLDSYWFVLNTRIRQSLIKQTLKVR